MTLPNCQALEQQKLLSTIDVLKKKSDAGVPVRTICPVDEQNAGLADLLAGSDSTNMIAVIDGASSFKPSLPMRTPARLKTR